MCTQTATHTHSGGADVKAIKEKEEAISSSGESG